MSHTDITDFVKRRQKTFCRCLLTFGLRFKLLFLSLGKNKISLGDIAKCFSDSNNF